ncbi:MAG: right-handed parallel beta-helix repeat-containing protein [Bacteroidales bacterium]|nr:right-handed parallel beta-helix repeat-containing protein [Bacteroidales bacterium]
MRDKKKNKEILLISILLIMLGLLLWVYYNHSNNNLEIQDFSIFCDFETQNDSSEFLTDNKKYIFSKGTVSKDLSYEGEQALFIPSWKEFQNVILLTELTANQYVTISFVRNIGSETSIVAQGIVNPDFYVRTNLASKRINDVWEEVNIKFTTGNYFKDTLKIYFHNSKKSNTYIDNFSLKVSKTPYYPEYKGYEPLLIYIEDKEYNKLYSKRNEALEKGILQTEDDSWVNAIVYGEGKMMNAEVRLKGDWLDHLKEDKWSFRIKLIDDSWRGMRVFSIQTPVARGYMNEWWAHNACKTEDMLATRYDFVPVYLNGKTLGIYSYEEHFQKELIESSLRREGPIIKFSETDFWDFFLAKTPNNFSYVTSVIEPFGEGKILKDSIKMKQFVLASNLLDSYRQMKLRASDIFDVKKTAKFIAFANATNSFHSLQWHNMRFYYNPVLSRLEPIAFDMFAGPEEFTFDNPFSPKYEISTLAYRHSMQYLISDTVFQEYYLAYIDTFTNTKNYKYFKNLYADEYRFRDSLQRIEFKPYSFNVTQFDSIYVKITNQLPGFLDSLSNKNYRNKINNLPNKPLFVEGMTQPLVFADKYIKVYTQSSKTLLFKCFIQFDIDIIGLGDEENLKSKVSHTITNKNSGVVKDVEIDFSENLSEFTHVYFSVHGNDSVFKTNIIKWPAPTTYNPRNDIAQSASDISNFTNEEKREVRFSGNISFDNHVYIPAGYTVIFDAGAQIDITNKSAFISNSTVLINGTKENPVKIFSSDKSANAFTVLQADDLSVCNYAIFDNLNTLDYNGWTLTGAVTFYESDVEFYNCTFTNNHCEDMLNTIRCNFLVKDCLIQNTYGDSHDSDFCTGTLDNCTFVDNGNDAIDFSTSDVIIANCKINGAGDKGISVGENTKARIKNVEINNIEIGIASKDLSHAEIDGCKISNATYGFVLLQKKPEFGPTSIIATNCVISNTWKESLIEKKSVLTLNGKRIEGKNPKLKAMFYE